MGNEHKKAMLAIFVFLFMCLLAGTVFITIQVQHYSIAAILLATTIIIGMDIRWVMKFEEQMPSVNE
ncbi:MAG: hypothetical protein CL679_14775 [Bermanella sp.]|nr:hypothetical protein [Bermanella sp.]|tara:strand:+ start:247 stop:447 length:201 start_codon:yes stop_codon:yes gene_type:complete